MDMKRPIVVAVFLAGLMLGTAVPVSGLGGTQITLNCDDGTSLPAVVDASTVTDLTQSVQALIDYPAGLSCTLLRPPRSFVSAMPRMPRSFTASSTADEH